MIKLRYRLADKPDAPRRSFGWWAIAGVIALSLGGCTNTTKESPSRASSELQVVTTFLPVTQFTKAVAGDRAVVVQLLPNNIGPHDYQATPEDAQKLANADVLVKNGLEMEVFLEGLIKNAGNQTLTVVDSSRGIQTIATEAIEERSPGAEDPDHAHDDETHAHEGENVEAGGHDHGAFNPHIWLDPKRAIQQVENIRDALIAGDPDGKEIYTANADAYIQRLRALDAETTKLLQPYAGKTFVAYHDFAPYFAQSYNLKANFLVDVPEENPSPNDVQRVINTVKATNLKTLLTEPQGGQEAFSALSRDLEVRVSRFDPIETGGPEATNPDYYLTTMRQNVKALVTAFTGPSAQSGMLWFSLRSGIETTSRSVSWRSA
jgi:zinc transport system substrate-binding protein